MNIRDALHAARNREPFLIDGLVSASSTLLVGPPKSGKGFVASAVIAALTGEDDHFVGRRVVKHVTNPAIAWTDDDGPTEYAERIASVSETDVTFYNLPIMRRFEDWHDLQRVVMAAGHDFLVIDNMTQALNGSLNDDEAIREFFAGVRLFVRDGIPVVVVCHSSEKWSEHGQSRTPMGHTGISAAARWQVLLSPRSSGELDLLCRGNSGGSHSIRVDMPEPGMPIFEVVGAEAVSDRHERSRQRAKETLDQRGEVGEWVVANCQGDSARRAASKIADQFGGTMSSHRSLLQRGAYGVDRSDSGTWLRTVPQAPEVAV